VNLERITDPLDERISGYRDLTDVALRSRIEPETGVFIAESAAVIERALAAGHRPVSVLMEDKWLERMGPILRSARDIPIFVGDRAVLEEITGFHVHRGALALMGRPQMPTVRSVIAGARRILVLEDIVDHTNVGAIIRSAAALGFDGFLVTPRCADPLYRRSVRVSMGTVFDLPWTRLSSWPGDLALLREAGFTIAAVTPGSDAIPLDEFDPPERLALILGTEGDGLTTQALTEADISLVIPMQRGVDSLNVAAAAAVMCWALRPSGEWG
jgi:tRNA G18 (ribose-2'-O)-methylase SpoU